MSTKRVLIVDDEPDIVETIKFSLEYENIECLAASDGEQALQLAKNEKPHVMILDIMLPKINGYKVSRLLKFDKSYEHIHIIMLTARTQEKDIRLGKETGADEYVTKPFEMDSLTALVKKYLKTAAAPAPERKLKPSSVEPLNVSIPG
jgi:DNA-binding response OmpR family regulator